MDSGSSVRIRLDLTIGKYYNGIEYTEELDEYRGKITIIDKYSESRGGFLLRIDWGDNVWGAGMLEKY